MNLLSPTIPTQEQAFRDSLRDPAPTSSNGTGRSGKPAITITVSDDDGASWSYACEVPQTALGRLYRAVTHSLMRRGLSVEDAIAQWCRSVGQIEEMVMGIPDRHVCRVTYEALCSDPQGTIKGVLHFLQLSGTSNVLKRSIADLHHISGSPSKFDPARQTIQFDDSYLSVFDERQLQYLRHAAQPLAHRLSRSTRRIRLRLRPLNGPPLTRAGSPPINLETHAMTLQDLSNLAQVVNSIAWPA
jgi:hypothetical protein